MYKTWQNAHLSFTFGSFPSPSRFTGKAKMIKSIATPKCVILGCVNDKTYCILLGTAYFCCCIFEALITLWALLFQQAACQDMFNSRHNYNFWYNIYTHSFSHRLSTLIMATDIIFFIIRQQVIILSLKVRTSIRLLHIWVHISHVVIMIIPRKPFFIHIFQFSLTASDFYVR